MSDKDLREQSRDFGSVSNQWIVERHFNTSALVFEVPLKSGHPVKGLS